MKKGSDTQSVSSTCTWACTTTRSLPGPFTIFSPPSPPNCPGPAAPTAGTPISVAPCISVSTWPMPPSTRVLLKSFSSMFDQLISINQLTACSPFSRRRSVLEIHKSSGIDNVGSIKFSLTVCLAIVFLLVYFSLWKGVRSTGKVNQSIDCWSAAFATQTRKKRFPPSPTNRKRDYVAPILCRPLFSRPPPLPPPFSPAKFGDSCQI